MKFADKSTTRADFASRLSKQSRFGIHSDNLEQSMTSEDEAWVEVVQWLSKLRLLKGVPFVYIVPTEEMLPNESIRFYHMDRNWLDALVDGAISVGTLDSRGALPEISDKNEQLKYSTLIDELNYSEVQNNPYRNKLLKSSIKGSNSYPSGGPITGFLLRSTVIRDFPGMEIMAYDAPGVKSVQNGYKSEHEDWATPEKRVQTIHQVRLSETILFCIFNGIPTHMRLQEPGEGIRLGLDPHSPPLDDPWDPDITTKNCYTLKFKGRDGYIVEKPEGKNIVSDIRYRKYTGDRSVIDIKGVMTQTRAREIENPEYGPDLTSSATTAYFTTLRAGGLIATQLMQFPYQQDFGYDSITQKPYLNSDQTATVEESDILSISQAELEEQRYERGVQGG